MMNDLEFNLVILDLNLPDAHGRDIAQHLEMHHPNTPIIFITGEHSAEVLSLEEECRCRDDRHFFNKPITSKKLYSAAENLIKNSLKKGMSN